MSIKERPYTAPHPETAGDIRSRRLAECERWLEAEGQRLQRLTGRAAGYVEQSYYRAEYIFAHLQNVVDREWWAGQAVTPCHVLLAAALVTCDACKATVPLEAAFIDREDEISCRECHRTEARDE